MFIYITAVVINKLRVKREKYSYNYSVEIILERHKTWFKTFIVRFYEKNSPALKQRTTKGLV